MQIYTPFVERLCRGGGRQPADVEEIVGVVLFNALNHLRSFEFRADRPSFRPWLTSIARHECVNWSRRQRSLGLPAGDMVEEPDQASPDDISLAEADWALFQAAYRQVRDEWQGDPQTIEAFEKTMIQRLKPSAVARELDVTAEFVHRAKHRVCKRIREVLREAGALDNADEQSA